MALKKLAGVMFTYNCLSQDYCFEEAIKSLQEFCDHVFVVDAGSIDGTRERLLCMAGNVTFTYLSHDKWHQFHGKEKLSHFTNIAIRQAREADYEYVFSLQADEIVHESSYWAIRSAVDAGYEAYLVGRANLWGSPYTYLSVPENRQPCSTHVIRLAKSKYEAYDDAESIAAPAISDYTDAIRIYHMGFVRKREVMVSKIRHMQADVFQVTPDAKLEGMDVFNPWAWFGKTDVQLIDERLPHLIQDWAKARQYE